MYHCMSVCLYVYMNVYPCTMIESVESSHSLITLDYEPKTYVYLALAALVMLS